MEERIYCFTGHRPQGFAWDYEDKNCEEHREYLDLLWRLVETAIRDGYSYFICGGAVGADMDFAETVLALKETYPKIRLEIAVPCRNQDLKWKKAEKERYQNILARASVINVLSEKYTPWCMHARNRYMVDRSTAVIAVWNFSEKGGTFATIQYATKKRKPVIQLSLPRLQEKI